MTETNWAARLPAVKSKADLVHASLREAIAAGDLRPGERVNMDELARRFGVSKIPVREAVKRLESEGLVVSRVHSGVVVAGIERTEMRGVFLARKEIDALVAGLAAERADGPLVEALDQVQESMRAALGAGEVDELQRLNSEFHRLLAEASGYRILADLTEQLLLTIRRYRVTTPKNARNWLAVLEEHHAVIEALRVRDPERAAAAAREHTASQAGLEIADPV
ncbi:GntR family transcriptional regulator [Streptomyces sp. NA04227]|uniref:GntR family transcriptional regulator n=1 Tax=Streptomyces sp. NA04227 TaxID=2742136 RepID=UPI001590D9B6|nr:GntR family transcriptional regulator [Streptomyces sp. NA04227]QKW10291.1 GntR family transcriptional regulator [Streptomyces sp. NA04227]